MFLMRILISIISVPANFLLKLIQMKSKLSWKTQLLIINHFLSSTFFESAEHADNLLKNQHKSRR